MAKISNISISDHGQ